MLLAITRAIIPVLLLCILYIGMARAITIEWGEDFEKIVSIQLEQSEKNSFLWRIVLADGYKTYWRYPGNGGYAPSLSYDKKRLSLVFPEPQRLNVLGFDSIGYRKELTLKGVLPKAIGDQKGHRTFAFDIPICSDSICIPYRGTIELTKGKSLGLVEASALKNLHFPEPIIAKEGSSLSVSFAWQEKPPLDDFFIALPSHPAFPPVSKPILLKTGKQWIMQSELTLPSTTALQKLSAIDLDVYSYTSGEYHTSFPATPIHAQDIKIENMVATASLLSHSALIALMIAFIGGLLVNVMPCVLPLIGLKWMDGWGLSRAQRRQYFSFQAGGIFISFGLLATIFMATAYFFNTPIWGQQLQTPYLLVLIGLFVTIFTLLMLSPHALPPAFAQYFHHNSRLKPFVSGLMIPVIATPCSAPFIGVSLASALVANSALIGGLIFLSLGAGMAFPSLIVAFLPKSKFTIPYQATTKFLKRFVHFLLIGFVFWLVWLSSQIHSELLAVLFLSTLALIAFFMWKDMAGHLRFGAIGFLSCSIVLLSILLPRPSVLQTFSPLTIIHLQERNLPVLVNVTADWCITCKANDLVLHSPTIQKWRQQHEIELIQADWTHPNAEIKKFLAAHHRYGIPFTAFYFPSKSHPPIILPEILTVGHLTNLYPSSLQ